MPTRRQMRELALQALYQYDARGVADLQDIMQSIHDAPHAEKTKVAALQVAAAAWTCHEQADALATSLAPTWPTNRQPVVDRNIIRLGYYEIASGMSPAAVAIDEAVELAKAYGGEKSPAFVNGVLDKIATQLRRDEQAGAVTNRPPLPGQTAPADPWLADALQTPADDTPGTPGTPGTE